MIPTTTAPFIFWKNKYLDLTDTNNNLTLQIFKNIYIYRYFVYFPFDV